MLKSKRKMFYLESKSGRNYIFDSGASFHLVSRVELTDHEASTIVALDEPIPIQTANGEVELHEKCEIFVRDLKVRVWAHILPDTVAVVLSLGLLVEELLFFLHLESWKMPYPSQRQPYSALPSYQQCSLYLSWCFCGS